MRVPASSSNVLMEALSKKYEELYTILLTAAETVIFVVAASLL